MTHSNVTAAARLFLFFATLPFLFVYNIANAQIPDLPPDDKVVEGNSTLGTPSIWGATEMRPFAVKVYWSSVDGAASYNLWYHTAAGGHVNLDNFTGNSHIHTGLTADIPYSYWVRAVDAEGNYGGWSSRLEVTPTGHMPAQPNPVTYSLTPGDSPQVTLSWPDDPHTDYYKVFAREIGKGFGNFVGGNITGTSYTHYGALYQTTWVYTVRGFNKYGGGIPSFGTEVYMLPPPDWIPCTPTPTPTPTESHIIIIIIPGDTPTPTNTGHTHLILWADSVEIVVRTKRE